MSLQEMFFLITAKSNDHVKKKASIAYEYVCAHHLYSKQFQVVYASVSVDFSYYSKIDLGLLAGRTENKQQVVKQGFRSRNVNLLKFIDWL